MGVEDGVIVARTDSLGAGLTQKIPVSQTPGDLADQYISFIDGEEVTSLDQVGTGDVAIRQGEKIIKAARLPNGLVRFKEGTGEDRVVLDCVTALQNGADLLWIETEKPHVGQIAKMVDRVKAIVPNAKLVYNNSPSFNWTLNFRQQVFDAWSEEGKDVSAYNRDDKRAGVFHHLITLPTYHTAAQSTDTLAKDYFGDKGMLAYVEDVQRKEIRSGLACVKHQDMAGSNIGDDHKEYFSGGQALKASGEDNTMNQFG